MQQGNDDGYKFRDAQAIDLWGRIEDARATDKNIFEEMRSNVRIVAGDQYKKKFDDQLKLYRGQFGLNNQTARIQITKNHTRRMFMEALNNLLNAAPWVVCTPNNEKELQDNKSATLNNSVLSYAKKKYGLKKKIRKWASDFLNVGECWLYLYWDPNKGEVVDYEQMVDGNGQPMFEVKQEMGQQQVMDPLSGQPVTVEVPQEVQVPIKDPNKPIYSGDFVFKRIMGWNMLRPSTAVDFDEAEWLAFTELLSPNDLHAWVGAEKYNEMMSYGLEYTNYFVFNEATSSFSKEDNVVEVATMLYKPCKKYPRGAYKIFTRKAVLFEGDLPHGEWPLVHATYEEAATLCRGLSFIKPLKSPQIEINRAASMRVDHQMTVGSDKVLHMQGTKLSTGFNSPGVRHISYTGGKEPVIIPGRSGEQFAPYLKDELNEMYSLQGMSDLLMEDSGKAKETDSFAHLFQNMRKKKRNSLYHERFSDFLVDAMSLYLRLARHYYDDKMLIPMIGKDEIVNMAEFRGNGDLMTSITVEDASEDLDTVYGKTMLFQTLIQYLGKDLPPSTISSIIKTMPFGLSDIVLDDLTLDQDIADNLILALERGEQPEPPQNIDINKLLGRIDKHMMGADFKVLDPKIQQMFAHYRQFYVELEQERMAKQLAADKDFIPTSGGRVRTDLKLESVRSDGSKATENAVLPANAVHWLLDRLSEQGDMRVQLEGLTPQTKADVMSKISTGEEDDLSYSPKQYESPIGN